MRFLPFYCYTLVSGLVSTILLAAPPTTDGLFPCGGQAGTNVEIALSGKADPWPPRFWCSQPDITFAPGEKSPLVVITIPSGAKPGPCLIRTLNDEGCSEPFLFLITGSKESVVLEDEKKGNQGIGDALIIETPLPCAIHGRLNPSSDVDCYQIPLKASQTLHAYMEGYTFRNGLDSILHLYGPKGERLMLGHDNAINPDPQFVFTAKEEGRYTLAVMAIATPPTANVSFHGGTKCSYRINLALKEADIPKRLLPEGAADDKKLTEVKTPPTDIFSTLKKEGQRETIRFAAKAKEEYQIDVAAFQHRFPTDPVFVLKNPDGKVIKEIDDGTTNYPDSNYLYKASTDGEHTIEISDRYGRGGPAYRYNLQIRKPVPDFSATVEKSNYVIEAGKESSIKINLTRKFGHKLPLKIKVEDLPPGVSLGEEPKAPEKSGDITIKLASKKESGKFSGPIRISLSETEGDAPKTRVSEFTFQDATTPAPFLIDGTETIWLTIKPAKVEKTEKPK